MINLQEKNYRKKLLLYYYYIYFDKLFEYLQSIFLNKKLYEEQ